MVGVIRTDMETTYGDFAPNDIIQSQWADDVNASLDDKVSKSVFNWFSHVWSLYEFVLSGRTGTRASGTVVAPSNSGGLISYLDLTGGASSEATEAIWEGFLFNPTTYANINRAKTTGRFKGGTDNIGPTIILFDGTTANSGGITFVVFDSQTLGSLGAGGGHAERTTTDIDISSADYCFTLSFQGSVNPGGQLYIAGCHTIFWATV